MSGVQQPPWEEGSNWVWQVCCASIPFKSMLRERERGAFNVFLLYLKTLLFSWLRKTNPSSSPRSEGVLLPAILPWRRPHSSGKAAFLVLIPTRTWWHTLTPTIWWSTSSSTQHSGVARRAAQSDRWGWVSLSTTGGWGQGWNWRSENSQSSNLRFFERKKLL